MTREKFYIEYPEFNHSGSPTSIMEKIVTDDFESRTCEWEVDEDTIYSTSCHNMWQFTEGDLTDNEIKFCPYCGSKIVSTDTKGEEDDIL